MASSSYSSSFQEYPFPFLLNVANYVSIKLSKVNYVRWRIQMRALLESQGLLGFIDGTKPAPNENEDYQLWRRSDRLVKGWIIGSLSEDVLDIVGDSITATAKDVWMKLENRFGHPNSQTKRDEVRAAVAVTGTEKEHLSYYLPLNKAALAGDWERFNYFFQEDRGASTARITANLDTALHLAVGTGNAIPFVGKLVDLMTTEAQCLKNIDGDTALMVAAMAGNTSATRILVERNLNLPYISNNDGLFPVHKAASSGKRDTLKYLLQVTKRDRESNPFEDHSGAQLLINVIVSGFFDVAIDLVMQFPKLATLDNHKGDIPLKAIARKASAFPSGNRSNFLERVIYSCVPVDLDSNGGVVENQANNYEMRAKFRHLCNLTLRNLVPGLQAVQDKKLIHHQALRLVKCLCEQIKSSNDYYLESFHFGTALLLAAGLGIHEVVEEIVDTFPYSIWYHNDDKHYIFQIAVVNRCEKVFNLIYQMSEHRNNITTPTDTSGNNILHLAGRLAPLHKLNLVSGAALQMQRELQWFQEVEKFVNPAYKEMLNSTGETPAMVFTKEHKNLMIEGEKWMKDTANSCTIAAALITTIVFAAAITVPGGNNGNGLPIFSQKKAFKTFVISDAVSLFTSITSLLMFLSILTSRYAEGDFLRVLPKRLIIGLFTLFFSITSMMIAFSATLYLVLDQKRPWILIPVAGFACLPVTSFVFLQFPLLMDAISSTYGRGIFGKQSNRRFY